MRRSPSGRGRHRIRRGEKTIRRIAWRPVRREEQSLLIRLRSEAMAGQASAPTGSGVRHSALGTIAHAMRSAGLGAKQRENSVPVTTELFDLVSTAELGAPQQLNSEGGKTQSDRRNRREEIRGGILRMTEGGKGFLQTNLGQTNYRRYLQSDGLFAAVPAGT